MLIIMILATLIASPVYLFPEIPDKVIEPVVLSEVSSVSNLSKVKKPKPTYTGFTFPASRMAAQSFRAKTTNPKIEILGREILNPAIDLIVNIETDNNGRPSGEAVYTKTIRSVKKLQWFEVARPTLDLNKTYWIVITQNDGFEWMGYTKNTYSGKAMLRHFEWESLFIKDFCYRTR